MPVTTAVVRTTASDVLVAPSSRAPAAATAGVFARALDASTGEPTARLAASGTCDGGARERRRPPRADRAAAPSARGPVDARDDRGDVVAAALLERRLDERPAGGRRVVGRRQQLGDARV